MWRSAWASHFSSPVRFEMQEMFGSGEFRMGKTIPRWPHPLRPSYSAAVAIQQRLAGRVIAATGGECIRFVAGLDAAFLEEGSR